MRNKILAALAGSIAFAPLAAFADGPSAAVMVNLSDASSTLTTAATWAVPVFGTFILLAAVLIGISFAGTFTGALVGRILGAGKNAIGKGRKGGGRRRRR